MSLDTWLPEYDESTRHSIEIAAAPALAWEALRTADFGKSWMLRLLLAARGIGRSRVDLNAFIDSEFVLLEESAPTRIVLGMAGRPQRSQIDQVTADEFVAYSTPMSVRIGWEFVIEPFGGHCIVQTSTRIQATDTLGLRAFRRYWRFIKPFSGLTRLAMLRVIRREAEGSRNRLTSG